MEKSNKRTFYILFVLLTLLFTGNPYVWSANVTVLANPSKSEPANNKAIPVFELPMPVSEQEKSYLGLSGTRNFKIEQIKAQVLIIEVYSFYCPHCQRSASQVNDLFRLIQGRTDMKEKIKMIGIGVGNSMYEVNAYRNRYKVPFPLFPDASMEISQKLGVKGTPTFIGFKMNGKGIQEQFYFAEGGFQDIHKFLNEIIRLSELK